MQRPIKLRRGATVIASLGLAAVIGCTADLNGGGNGSGTGNDESSKPPGAGGLGESTQALCSDLPEGTLGETPLRQLTRDEYQNSVADLTGIEPDVKSYPMVASEGFQNDTDVLSVDPELASYLQQQAEQIADAIVSDASKLENVVGCESPDDACVTKFIESFGKRVLRRPLTSDEKSAYFDLYTWGKGKSDPLRGTEVVLEALLQDPYFVHRVEDPKAGEVTDYELATRLSYFLWETTPDKELIEKADAGELKKPEVLEAQVRRMLSDERARKMVLAFHDQWLHYGAVEGAIKDPVIYPEFDETLMQDLRKETEQFIDHVVWSGEAKFSDLLSAPYSYMNERVAEHYGIEGVTGDEFRKVDLSETDRRGYLMQGSFLASQATADATHPIKRGVFVRRRILCQDIPPPPPNVNTSVPAVDYNSTRREQFEQITSPSDCAGCHTLINPAGFVFENYDSVGRYQTEDHGNPVDATVELTNGGSVDGAYDDATQFVEVAAQSDEASSCAVQHWLTFATGRPTEKNDSCSLATLQKQFADSGGDVQELIVSIAKSPAFLTRTPSEAK